MLFASFNLTRAVLLSSSFIVVRQTEARWSDTEHNVFVRHIIIMFFAYFYVVEKSFFFFKTWAKVKHNRISKHKTSHWDKAHKFYEWKDLKDFLLELTWKLLSVHLRCRLRASSSTSSAGTRWIQSSRYRFDRHREPCYEVPFLEKEISLNWCWNRNEKSFFFNLPVGRCPNERITTPSSAIVIDPSSSLSNNMKTSLNSEMT